jgi:DNA polymerase-3 subunit beta
MKFICQSADFISAVNTVAHGTSAKTINPILEGIKIVASGDGVTFFATDLEIYIRKTIKADVKTEGAAVLSGKLFCDYVNKIGDGQISLTGESNAVIIEYGDNNTAKFTCMAIEEYPDLINLTAAPNFAIEAKELRELIAKTTLFTSTDNARPILKGVLFEIENSSLTGVALDGYRLSKIVKSVRMITGATKIVIPARSLDEIKKLLTDDKEEIDIIIENKFIQIKVGSVIFASRLIDGEFINYKQIIPTDFSSAVIVETAAILASITRANLLARAEKVSLVALTITDKQILIKADSDSGKIDERVPANLNGADLTIAFNVKYLFEALNAITDDFIKISFNTATSPCVITSAKKADYLFLVLPLRMN